MIAQVDPVVHANRLEPRGDGHFFVNGWNHPNLSSLVVDVIEVGPMLIEIPTFVVISTNHWHAKTRAGIISEVDLMG